MSDDEMRRAVLEYYREYLEPRAWLSASMGSGVDCLHVNGEEKSVPIIFPTAIGVEKFKN